MSIALLPYMASRNWKLDTSTLYGPSVALFPYNGSITFRWGVIISGTTPPKANYILLANGKWGLQDIDHRPILVISGALPTANVTYANETQMQDDVLNRTPEVNLEFDTTTATIATYTGATAKRWMCVKWKGLQQWVPIAVRIADGTANIMDGATRTMRACNVFYCVVPVADIPKVNGAAMSPDQAFDLCWASNGRHATGDPGGGYDATFKLSPIGYPLQDTLIERVELNARVAGQRAIKKDEMITRSQLEAGNFVTIGYRDALGDLPGYLSDSTKGFNIVIESADHRLIGGTNIVTSIVGPTDKNADAWGSAAFTSGLTKILFSDEPDHVLDATMQVTGITHNTPADQWGNTSIPVKWIYYDQGGGEAYFSARTLHNGLWASHNNLVTVTPKGAGPYDTLAHIQFKDSSSITWTISNANLESDVGYRPGIVVEATNQYYWRVSDGSVADDIDTGDTIVFTGTSGVAVTNIPPGPYNIVEIDRPLTIQDDGVDVGLPDTTTINFDSQLETTTAQPVNFVITDDTLGVRTIKGYVPEASSQPAVFKSHWYHNLDQRGIGDNIAFSQAADVYNGLRMASYAVVGPGGPHQGGLPVATYQKILSSSSVITEGTIVDGQAFPPFTGDPFPNPERSYGPNETLFDQRLVKVTDTGVYDINAVIAGITDRHPVCAANHIGAGHHRVNCHLFIQRAGIFYNYQRFGMYDFFQWHVPNEITSDPNSPYGSKAAYQDGHGQGNSVPWEVQGSGLVYLESEDEIFFVLSHRAIGDERRIFFVGFFTFDMHKVYDGMPSLAITAHGTHDWQFGQDGALLNWEFRYGRNTW